MKVFVVGAGGQGGPAASILSRDENISEVLLGDINVEAAEQVKRRINSDKIRVVKVDASSKESLTEHAEGADVLIDLVIPEFSPAIVETAIAVRAHYVSTAFDKPWWDELIEGRPLSYHEELKDAGLTAVLGCGMAPGFINVIARRYADELDTVESIKLRIAKKKLGQNELFSKWNPGWSPRQALIDCDEPAYYVEDGVIHEAEHYSGLETWEFPEPLGAMEVTHHAHEEPLTMAYTIGKGLRYCDFKYYLSPQPAVFVTAGLASTEEISVKGINVKPIDLLLELIPKSENAFLSEDPAEYAHLDEIAHVCMMAEVTGTKDGAPKTRRIHMPKLTANGDRLSELFGTSLINVALPAVIAAKMAVDGRADRGIVFPESLDAQEFLDRFLATGIPYKWREL
jgi:saccharopine dehydrogenase-like NADP-dependent oxidoreductase